MNEVRSNVKVLERIAELERRLRKVAKNMNENVASALNGSRHDPKRQDDPLHPYIRLLDPNRPDDCPPDDPDVP